MLDDLIEGNSNTEMKINTCNQRLHFFTDFKYSMYTEKNPYRVIIMLYDERYRPSLLCVSQVGKKNSITCSTHRHRKAFVAKSIFYPFKNKVIVLLCDYLHETICLLCVLIIT